MILCVVVCMSATHIVFGAVINTYTPSVSSITPQQIFPGTLVSLSGQNITNASVAIDTLDMVSHTIYLDPSVITPNTVSFFMPALVPGKYLLSLDSTYGSSDYLPIQISALPPAPIISSVFAHDPHCSDGVVSVNITGQNFDESAVVLTSTIANKIDLITSDTIHIIISCPNTGAFSLAGVPVTVLDRGLLSNQVVLPIYGKIQDSSNGSNGSGSPLNNSNTSNSVNCVPGLNNSQSPIDNMANIWWVMMSFIFATLPTAPC